MFGDFYFGWPFFGQDEPEQAQGGTDVTVQVSGQAATGENGTVLALTPADTVGTAPAPARKKKWRWIDLIPDWNRPPEPPKPPPVIDATARVSGQAATGANGAVTVRISSAASFATRAGQARGSGALARCGQRITCAGTAARSRSSLTLARGVKNLHDDELAALLAILG